MKNLTKERYMAGMVLSGVGDALGYRNGYWEFCTNAEIIHTELETLGGLRQIKVKKPNWPVSDDTVMHLATAQALIENSVRNDDNNLLNILAVEYKKCVTDMLYRHPGDTCMTMCKRLEPGTKDGLFIPFNSKGGGCGAAMRSMCIGLRYPDPKDIETLIGVSIESGRLTHHHPTGYLGSLASALFTSYAVQDKPVREWGKGLIDTLKKAKNYVEERGVCVKDNIEHWEYFTSKWQFYLRLRNISDGESEPRFPMDDNQSKKRDQFYTFMSYDNWGGASGHDAPMIALDAILACKGSWKDLCDRAMFHGGDSDSTGVIAGCLYGVLYGLEKVPPCNYNKVEYQGKLESVAKKLCCLAEGKRIKEDNTCFIM